MGAGDDFGATLRNRLHAEFDPMPVCEEGMARHGLGALEEPDPDAVGRTIRAIIDSIRLTSQGGPVASIDVERIADGGGGLPVWSITFYCVPNGDA